MVDPKYKTYRDKQRKNNPEGFKARASAASKRYYNKKGRIKVKCSCGCIISTAGLVNHQRTWKHLLLLNGPPEKEVIQLPKMRKSVGRIEVDLS